MRAAPLKTALLRSFPPPAFMRMRGVGIDVTDRAIKYLVFDDLREGLRVNTWGTIDLADGAIVKGAIEDPQAVTKALSDIRAKTGMPFAYVSLPEERAYLFITTIPKSASTSEARTAIELTLKENVPLSPTEAVFDFVPLEAGEGSQTHVAVSVYPEAIVEQYVAVVREAGFTPIAFEIEGAAAARAIAQSEAKEAAMVVDLGRAGSGVSIVNAGTLVFTSTLEVSGDDITRALSRGLNISYAEAETLKAKHGFVKNAENEAAFNAMVGIVSALRDEVMKHFAYWQVHSAKEYSFAQPIGQIVLVGGNANIKGFREYLAAQSPVPVTFGNVWGIVASFEEYVPPIHRIESYRYATAIGLALRGVGRP